MSVSIHDAVGRRPSSQRFTGAGEKEHVQPEEGEDEDDGCH
jgi:hypothetical protein